MAECVQPSSMRRDKINAKTLISQLENNVADPFQMDRHFDWSISSGVIPTTEILKSVLSAIESGEYRINMINRFLYIAESMNFNSTYFKLFTDMK